MLLPSGENFTATLNRLSASAGRLGGFFAFPLRREFYRDPEPGFRIGGAVGVFALALPWDFYRDPEPGFRIGGAVGGFFSFPLRRELLP